VLLVGIVTASVAASEAERNAALLSRFSPNVEEQASSPSVPSAALYAVGSRISRPSANSHLPQSLPAVDQSSNDSQSSSAVVTLASTNVVSYRYLPATNVHTGESADVSALLFDDQLLPGLPPPLIPVPDRYQPLVDLGTSEAASSGTTVASGELPDMAIRTSLAVQQPRSPKTGECSVCMECEPNAALYPCGHMCMCYDCAVSVQKLRGALCPICRQPIIDILRIYRP